MTYKTRCNGNYPERIDIQAENIKRERESRMKLSRENSDLRERIRYLEGQLINQRLQNTRGEQWFG
ncbi:hypothetical protein [Salinicoccus sp. HZC-1]|uniref:hypothetical protein n=1 Tax=Salinicoccus sp. HZC-1 TaxID=3385497 RepID=UPI00398B393D